MTQAMILMGVLAICAVAGLVLAHRPGWTHGPDEPTGSYTAPTPPVPSPPPATVVPSLPPVVVEVPEKPSQPLPAALSVTPAEPSRPTVQPVRRSRNSGFTRFAPTPARTRAGRA
jgi:hypothetical protein